MKKFFEKYDLFKITGILLIVAILFSWLIGTGAFGADGSFTCSATNVVGKVCRITDRVGFFDLTYYIGLTLRVFFNEIVFLFVVAGFYSFLSSMQAYNTITSNIAAKFKGKEKLFVAITTFIFAALSGIATEQLYLLALVPFVIAILSKMKVDNLIGLYATFGGILVGMLGATYSTRIVGTFVDLQFNDKVTYGYELVTILILFVIALLILIFFEFSKIDKLSKRKAEELLVDPFASAEGSKKSKKIVQSVPVLAVELIVGALLLILGYIGWEAAFGVTVFNSIHEAITSATIFDNQIFGYLLGNHSQNSFIGPMGSWVLSVATGIILFMTFIIKVTYHIPWNKVGEEFGNGFKKIGKTVVLIIMIYTVLVISVQFQTIPAIVSKLTGLVGTNIGSLFVSGLLASTMFVDFYYVVGIMSPLFQTFTDITASALILQSSYGLVQFVAPTSIILMAGLSMLNIKYKDYLRFMWKFLLAMLIVIIIILAIMVYA